MTPPPRLLAVMGSGETAPTMSSVHAELLARLGPPPVPAVLLDTPFGFQENAAEICSRTVDYFRRRVGHPLAVASCPSLTAASPLERETFLARVSEAAYVFAGPGSPSYALRQWRGSGIAGLLAAKLRRGGCVTFASAAAIGLGTVALPVYEVYKVGEEPRWLEGLDVLAAIGLRAAVIPHYDNAEGGTHDTRYCYMGERRLRRLEEQLPDGAGILGVDEHTAAIVDVGEGRVSVRGRGALTIRRRGLERRVEAGTALPLEELRRHLGEPAGGPTAAAAGAHPPTPPAFGGLPAEDAAERSARAESALREGRPEEAVAALLEIEAQLGEGAGDALDGQGREAARASLRRLIVRLGEAAREGTVDPRRRVAPLVEGILAERRRARDERRWEEADRLRDVLGGCGVEVRDTAGGTEWALRDGLGGGADPT